MQQIKRLENLGTLKFYTIKNDLEYLEAIETLIKYKKEQFKDTGATDIFLSDQIKKFYMSSIYNGTIDLEINLSVLRFNNKIIADFNWSPGTGLKKGLEKTYKWIFDQIKSGDNTNRFTKSY